jgi:hypothetical protein
VFSIEWIRSPRIIYVINFVFKSNGIALKKKISLSLKKKEQSHVVFVLFYALGEKKKDFWFLLMK